MRWKAIQVALLIGIAASTTEVIAATQIADGTEATASSASRINTILDRWQAVEANKGGDVALWRDMMNIQLKQVSPSTLDRLLALNTGSNVNTMAEFYQSFIYTLGADIGLRLQAQKVPARAVAPSVGIQSGEATSSLSGIAGRIHPNALGSVSIDQTFTPITPCRVVDTRNVGGPIGPLATRNFFFYTNNGFFNWGTNQGGVVGAAISVCPGTFISGFVPSAAVATLTVTGQGGNGNLIAWQGTSPVASASTMSYPASGDTSSLATIPEGGRSGTGPGGAVQDFGVFVNAFTSTNVVVDIVGYYTRPAATALDCVRTGPTTTDLDTNTRNYHVVNNCGAGYTAVSAACEAAGADLLNLQQSGGGAIDSSSTHCFGRYVGSSTVTVQSYSICCRVPGH